MAQRRDDIEDALAEAWIIERSGAIDIETADSYRSRKFDMQKVRRWLESKGFGYESIFVDRVPGEASRACLEVWLSEDIGVDIEGLDLQELKAQALSLNREAQIRCAHVG